MVLTEEVKNFVGVNNTSLSLSRQKYGEFMSLFGAGQAEVNYRYSMAVNTLGQTEPLDAQPPVVITPQQLPSTQRPYPPVAPKETTKRSRPGTPPPLTIQPPKRSRDEGTDRDDEPEAGPSS